MDRTKPVAKVKSMLYRTRIGLKKYLEQEGFFDEM